LQKLITTSPNKPRSITPQGNLKWPPISDPPHNLKKSLAYSNSGHNISENLSAGANRCHEDEDRVKIYLDDSKEDLSGIESKFKPNIDTSFP
jgi:hypothetical protein